MRALYFTEQRINALARHFADDWKSQPHPEKYPFSKTTVNAALKKMDPAKKPILAVAAEAPGLLVRVDEITWKERQMLAPVLGAGGRLTPRLQPTNGRNGADNPLKNLRLPDEHPEPRKPKGERVKWDSEEREALTDAWMEEWLAAPEIGLHIDSFIKAMHKTLVEERWRKVAGVSQIPEIYKAALTKLRLIVRNGLTPPEPKVEYKDVPVAYDPIKVAREEVPLPKLAGIVAERQAQQQEAFYRMALPANGNGLFPKPAGPTTATPDRAQIEAQLPRVQVIGFRPAQHTTLLEKFAKKPVLFEPSIDPAATLEPSKLAPKCALYLVESTNAPEPWQKMVVAQIDHGKREKCYGASRVYEHIEQFVGKWITAHQELFNQYKSLPPKGT